MPPSPAPPCTARPLKKRSLFSGIAGYCARYRRGYPAGVFDAIIAGFDLVPASEILDLGCGTGNVAIPLIEPGGGIACLSRNSRFCQATYH